MDGRQHIYTIYITIVLYLGFSVADREYMVSKAGAITVSINFETKLECVMNIQPDNFQWKFYPLDKKEACNPKARISLTTSPFQFVPTSKYENMMQKKMSLLTLQADSISIAGDYQCLAHYGASVVASVPWRVTITNITNFSKQERKFESVVEGNTVNWRCDPPISNPQPYIDYFKNGVYLKTPESISTKSLILPNVILKDSGNYTCQAANVEGTVKSDSFLSLHVVKSASHQPPRFIVPPKESYEVIKNDNVFLECSAVGNPPPKLTWQKRGGLIDSDRSDMLYGGLLIRNVSKDDHGVYECTQINKFGNLSRLITLNYIEPPSINCMLESTDITQGENLDIDCSVSGSPEPEVTWFLNGFVVTDDKKIFAKGNQISFRPAEKRHAGNLQIFARNVAGTIYRSIFIKVIPLSTTQENTSDIPVAPTRGNNKKNNSRKMGKHGKMVPPSRPTISRISDESVLLRWRVQSKGLPILFFKVQYKELGPENQHDSHNRGKGAKWMTTNADIDPHITSFEVTNLKPDHYYRFRIAAVYSNNDNKNSPNSEKFLLRKLDFDNRNPLPVPIITNVEPINSTAVKIYWKYDPQPNITIEGFVVNYNSASSAADYMKATVDGAETNSYILSHLQPDTVYDIKLQTFSSKSASLFSYIQKVKTLGLVSTTVSPSLVSPSSNIENAGVSKLYIIIIVAIVGAGGVILAAVCLFIFCRKSKQKKNGNRDDHHIQADGNEYVVGPKSPRTNGCVPGNRITITANPLADADNKSQNMIEMSCLSSQNNNCSTQPSVSAQDSPTNSRDKKIKNYGKRIRNKHDTTNTPGENFV